MSSSCCLYHIPLQMRVIRIEAKLMADIIPNKTELLPLGAQTHRRNQENNALIHHALKVYVKYIAGQLILLQEKGYMATVHDEMVMNYLKMQIIRAKRLDRKQEIDIINSKLVKWTLS